MLQTRDETETIIYQSLARLFDYPGEADGAVAEQVDAISWASAYPEAALLVRQFGDAINRLAVAEREELYTRTFDIAPICIPYVTAYIYGEESFERGDLMAKLRLIYAEYGFDCGGELPDHIAVLLRFAALISHEERLELIEFCLESPITLMVERLEGSENPYSLALKAVEAVLKETMRASHD